MLCAAVLEMSSASSCRNTVYHQIFLLLFPQAVQTNSDTSDYTTVAALRIPCSSFLTSHPTAHPPSSLNYCQRH
jgi:hypothetical protein